MSLGVYVFQEVVYSWSSNLSNHRSVASITKTHYLFKSFTSVSVSSKEPVLKHQNISDVWMRY